MCQLIWYQIYMTSKGAVIASSKNRYMLSIMCFKNQLSFLNYAADFALPSKSLPNV